MFLSKIPDMDMSRELGAHFDAAQASPSSRCVCMGALYALRGLRRISAYEHTQILEAMWKKEDHGK